MIDDPIDIDDIEAFIDGLKISFDSLETMGQQSQGFQAQLAKAISALRLKKTAKIEPNPKFIGNFTPEDLKNFLLNKLEFIKNLLETGDFDDFSRRKFNLLMELAKIREKINQL